MVLVTKLSKRQGKPHFYTKKKPVWNVPLEKTDNKLPVSNPFRKKKGIII